MSNTKKIEISNVSMEDALSEIKNLSKGSDGLIVNKNSMSSLSKVLSGESLDIEKIASSEENNKVVSIGNNEVKPAPVTKKAKAKTKLKKEIKVKPN